MESWKQFLPYSWLQSLSSCSKCIHWYMRLFTYLGFCHKWWPNNKKPVQSFWLNIQSPAQWKHKVKFQRCSLNQEITAFWIYSNLQKISLQNSHMYHALIHMFKSVKFRAKCLIKTTVPLYQFCRSLMCMCQQQLFPMEFWGSCFFSGSSAFEI